MRWCWQGVHTSGEVAGLVVCAIVCHDPQPTFASRTHDWTPSRPRCRGRGRAGNRPRARPTAAGCRRTSAADGQLTPVADGPVHSIRHNPVTRSLHDATRDTGNLPTSEDKKDAPEANLGGICICDPGDHMITCRAPPCGNRRKQPHDRDLRGDHVRPRAPAESQAQHGLRRTSGSGGHAASRYR